MLSAESAAGQFPVEAVAMMDRIIKEVERDPFYRQMIDAAHPEPGATFADAICCALRRATNLLPVAAAVTYTRSGYTSLRTARERPAAPILSMAMSIETARRLTAVWGVHSVHVREIQDANEMGDYASETARKEGFAQNRRRHRHRRRNAVRRRRHDEPAQDRERLIGPSDALAGHSNRRTDNGGDMGAGRERTRRPGRGSRYAPPDSMCLAL